MTREEAITIIDCERPYASGGCGANDEEIEEAFNMAINALEQLTSYEQTINKLTKAISEQEPKTGHWKIIPCGNNHGEYRPPKYACSECGWEIDLCRGLQQDTGHRLFCEHCGAKMVELHESEEQGTHG